MDEIDELVRQTEFAVHRCWFVQVVRVFDRTNSTITLHLEIGDTLFVQVFFSQRSQRLNLALVGSGGRLYGRDREHGVWHEHPFHDPDRHEPTPLGMSSDPVAQFLSEVEEVLVANGLI